MSKCNILSKYVFLCSDVSIKADCVRTNRQEGIHPCGCSNIYNYGTGLSCIITDIPNIQKYTQYWISKLSNI